MSHKHNEDQRHKISNQKLKITNWATYNESLRRRDAHPMVSVAPDMSQ